MPKYRVELTDGRKFEVESDGPPSEQDVLGALGSGMGAPAAPPASPAVAYNGITGSIFPEQTQLNFASKIAGSPQQPTQHTPTDALSQIPYVGGILNMLGGSIADFGKTAVETGGDIASGLVSHPMETLRGGAAGLAEGAMQQASPLSIAMNALPFLRSLRGKTGAAVPETPAPPPGVRTSFPLAPDVPTATAVQPGPLIEGGGFSRPYTPPVRPPVRTPLPTETTATGVPSPLPEPVVAPKLKPSAPTGTSTGWSIPAVSKTADEALTAGTHPAEVATSIERALPQTVAEMAKDLRRGYGSERAGKMLFGDSVGTKEGASAIERLAPGPSRIPLMTENAALDSDYLRRIMDPRGGIKPKVAIGAGAGVAGALIGGTQGDTTEEHLTNAAIGGAAGVAAASVAVPMLASLAASSAPKLLQNGLYTSILARPTAIAKAYLGGVGGAVSNAVELMEGGNVKQGSAILTKLFSPSHVTEVISAFRNPGAIKSGSALASEAGYGGETLVGRIFDASNAPAIKAMQAGGTSLEDAWRFTLSGAPTTPLGKDVLNLWNKWFSLRLGTSLFPRVGVQVLERGLERTPLGLVDSLGLNTAGSGAVRAARALNGPAAALAAYQWGDQVPDWGKPFVAAAAGPYGLQVGAGLAASTAARQGKSGGQQAGAALNSIGGNTPFPDYGAGESLKQIAGGSSLVPGLLGDVARARDPYERSTAGDFFGRAKAKIPGLRETLPIRQGPTNIAGEPVEDRSSPVKRLLTAAQFQGDPHKGIPEPVVRELERLDVKLNPPAADKKVTLGKREFDVPPDAINRLQQERRQYVVPAVQKLLGSPIYQAASDQSKKARLESVIRKAEAAGSARAKSTLTRLLKGAS